MDILINPKRSSSDSDSNSNDDANLWLLLPEELMFYIFTFVPLNCLINSVRYVCEPWAAIIATSHFAEVCKRRIAHSKPGIYVENRKSKSSSYFLGFKDGVNGQFERTELGTPPEMGVLIGTCDGILLLLDRARQFFVANPILKCWLRIPRFPISKLDLPILCQCTITHVPRTAKFKLFNADVLVVSGTSWYVFYALRIGIDSSWKEIARKEAGRPTFPLFFSWEPLYNGGNNLYWITNEEVIVMDVDKEIIVREYPLPPITTDSSLFPMFLRIGDRLSRIVHINDTKKSIHFGYNVKTKQLTKIEDIDMGDFEVWLHTNSLVSLPTTPA